MQFKFPKHPVGSNVWFLSKTDRQVFGRVDMITIVLKGDEVSIYYGLIDEKKGQHTVAEDQVVDNRTEIRQPKFNVSDEIHYEYYTEENKTAFDTGIITAIRTTIEEGSQLYEYVIDDNWDYPVAESEITGMADSIFNDAMGD